MTHFVELPYAPSINHYYGSSGSRKFIKEPGVEFRWRVLHAVKQAKLPKLTGRLVMVVRVFPPDKRKRDLDNVLKATLDALQHAGAYENDSQIDDLQVKRGNIVQDGRIEVMLAEIA